MATAEDDAIVEKQNWHWRNTMRPVRFFNLDARAAIPFLILLVYARPITIGLTLVITGIFHFLETRGYTVPSALRSLRVWLGGYHRPGQFSYAHRRMKDFG